MTSEQNLHLLLFNLSTDADALAQGFTTAWINALAERCASIDVVTMRAGRLMVADHVRVFSVGKEKGYSEARRAVEFYRILWGLLREKRYDACFVHMNPLFAVMGAPLLKMRGIPTVLWYAHKSVTLKLRLAEKLVDKVVTASPESFRLKSKKVIPIGHGVDTNIFTPQQAVVSDNRPFTILSVSRIAPVKRVEVIIEAARSLAGRADVPPFRLLILGDAEAQNTAYLGHLRELASDIGEQVSFGGHVPFEQVAAVYQQVDVMVNMSSTGSVDKAVLEAMACGVTVITANEAFRDMLTPWGDSLLTAPGSAAMLADKLAGLMRLSKTERDQMGRELREIVVRDHGLAQLAERLIFHLSG